MSRGYELFWFVEVLMLFVTKSRCLLNRSWRCRSLVTKLSFWMKLTG